MWAAFCSGESLTYIQSVPFRISNETPSTPSRFRGFTTAPPNKDRNSTLMRPQPVVYDVEEDIWA
jgi:hypothetical protein